MMQPRDIVLDERFVYVYQCRYCGKIEAMPTWGQEKSGEDAAYALKRLADGDAYDEDERTGKLTVASLPKLLCPHVCNERQVGMCDLIGAVPEREAAEMIRSEE